MEILRHMIGEELLLLKIAGGEGISDAIDAELDNRAITGRIVKTTPNLFSRTAVNHTPPRAQRRAA